ncbi:PadR family transcriptional regulator [Nakamurella antarctica]|uniref:PadR family transcriptional regulator n=1 Tax=Nakamurella antarctica TaxID=1902245 RepID=UPI001EF03239|nr:PadR family transcriptional regulator [Nakamurella antarctica]
MPVSAQMRKGVLEYCVLACMISGPTYGLAIAKRLAVHPDLLTSEGTLYPLLSRLRKQGLVETTWQESPTGPPRRYYSLTAQGLTSVAGFAAGWGPFSKAVSDVLREAM